MTQYLLSTQTLHKKGEESICLVDEQVGSEGREPWWNMHAHSYLA